MQGASTYAPTISAKWWIRSVLQRCVQGPRDFKREPPADFGYVDSSFHGSSEDRDRMMRPSLTNRKTPLRSCQQSTAVYTLTTCIFSASGTLEAVRRQEMESQKSNHTILSVTVTDQSLWKCSSSWSVAHAAPTATLTVNVVRRRMNKSASKTAAIMFFLPVAIILALLAAMCVGENDATFYKLQLDAVEQLERVADDFNLRAKAAVVRGANISLETHPRKLLDVVARSINATGQLALWFAKFRASSYKLIPRETMEDLIDITTTNEKVVLRGLLQLANFSRGEVIPPVARLLEIVTDVQQAAENLHLITAVIFMNVDELKPLLQPPSSSNVIASIPLHDFRYKKFAKCVLDARAAEEAKACFTD